MKKTNNSPKDKVYTANKLANPIAKKGTTMKTCCKGGKVKKGK